MSRLKHIYTISNFIKILFTYDISVILLTSISAKLILLLSTNAFNSFFVAGTYLPATLLILFIFTAKTFFMLKDEINTIRINVIKINIFFFSYYPPATYYILIYK